VFSCAAEHRDFLDVLALAQSMPAEAPRNPVREFPGARSKSTLKLLLLVILLSTPYSQSPFPEAI